MSSQAPTPAPTLKTPTACTRTDAQARRPVKHMASRSEMRWSWFIFALAGGYVHLYIMAPHNEPRDVFVDLCLCALILNSFLLLACLLTYCITTTGRLPLACMIIFLKDCQKQNQVWGKFWYGKELYPQIQLFLDGNGPHTIFRLDIDFQS